METESFGIKLTLIEPAAYATDFNGSSGVRATQMAAYDKAREETMKAFRETPAGDPSHTAGAVLQIVDMDKPPLRLFLGKAALPLVSDRYAKKMVEWERYASLTNEAQ